jgi:hypothetical protein
MNRMIAASTDTSSMTVQNVSMPGDTARPAPGLSFPARSL